MFLNKRPGCRQPPEFCADDLVERVVDAREGEYQQRSSSA